MKKLSLFLLIGMLFALNSCENSLDSLEDSKLTEEPSDFITFEGPDGKVITKAIPEELRKKNEVAKSRIGYHPCDVSIDYNGSDPWAGVSVDGSNTLVFSGMRTIADCPCDGYYYIWLVTSGGGNTITWENHPDATLPPPAGSGVPELENTLPLPNGSTYEEIL